jgi:serine/threonine protein phosphatase PrpC
MGNLLGSPVTDKETHTGSTQQGGGSPSLKWGLSSMQGWRVHMEDAHIAEGNLYATLMSDDDEKNPRPREKLSLPGHALFAVFDGHGGTFSAMYAGRNFLRILSSQPKWLEYAQMLQDSSVGRQQKMATLEQALQQAFVETDYEIALAIKGSPHPHANQSYHDEVDHNQGGTGETNILDESGDAVMRDAATKAAADHVSALDDDGDSGTTACMVLITPDAYVCANAGDSRAIFSRRNPTATVSTPLSQQRQAVALSYDHKPDDEPEERRIRAAGGYVAGGRVEGDLAVSRGLGDFRFKSMPLVLNNVQLETDTSEFKPGDQKVSPIPDILVQSRNEKDDEFVIVACDGIWDVQSNQDCVQEVAQMVTEGETDMGLICEEVRSSGCIEVSRVPSKELLFLTFVMVAVTYDPTTAFGHVSTIGLQGQHDGHCRSNARIETAHGSIQCCQPYPQHRRCHGSTQTTRTNYQGVQR